MLNRYEENLVAFFHDYADFFAGPLIIELPDKFTYVQDILPRIVDFIDKHLRKEMAIHEVRSAGYQHFLDMLIELHTNHDNELRLAIIDELNATYQH